MTAQQPDIQWYIARDGKQHGPLSDVEMRTFVAQGHLKPTDLIWRPGFADWRPAPAVFPFQSPEPVVTAPHMAARPSVAPARTHAPEPERSFEPKRIRVAQEPDEGQPSRTSRMIGLGLVLALLFAGGGWYVWQKGSKDGEAAAPEAAVVEPSDTAPSEAPTQTAELAPGIEAPSSEAVDAGAEALDAKFQQTPMWSVVKREFPDWYGERLREAAKLTAEKQPEIAISKHLAEISGHASPPARQGRTRRQHAQAHGRRQRVPQQSEEPRRAQRRRLLRLHLARRDRSGRARPDQLAGSGRGPAGAGRGHLRGDRRRPPLADHARSRCQDRLRGARAAAHQARLEGGGPQDLLQPDRTVARAAGPRLPDGAGLVRRAPLGGRTRRRRSASSSRP